MTKLSLVPARSMITIIATTIILTGCGSTPARPADRPETEGPNATAATVSATFDVPSSSAATGGTTAPTSSPVTASPRPSTAETAMPTVTPTLVATASPAVAQRALIYAGQPMPTPPADAASGPEASWDAMTAALALQGLDCDPWRSGTVGGQCQAGSSISRFLYVEGDNVRIDYVSHGEPIRQEEAMVFMLTVLGHYLQPDVLGEFQGWFEAHRSCDSSPTTMDPCGQDGALDVGPYRRIVLDQKSDSAYRLNLTD